MAELKATKFKTQHGKTIYTLGDEKVSEKSITIKMPNGSWVNVPTIHNGKIYTEFQIMDMLKNFEIMPTSRHASEKEAIAAAKIRSDDIIRIPAKAYDISWRNPENKHLFDADGNRTNKLADGTAMTGAQRFAAYQTYPKEKISEDSIMHPNNKNKTQGYSQAKLGQIEKDYQAKQSAEQTARLTEIMNNQELEKQDDYYKYYPNSLQNTDPNWSGSAQPEFILNKATQYLEPEGSALAAREAAIGRSMASYGLRNDGSVKSLNNKEEEARLNAQIAAGIKREQENYEAQYKNKDQLPDYTGLSDEGDENILRTNKDQLPANKVEEARLNAQIEAGKIREQEIFEDMYSKKDSILPNYTGLSDEGGVNPLDENITYK